MNPETGAPVLDGEVRIRAQSVGGSGQTAIVVLGLGDGGNGLLHHGEVVMPTAGLWRLTIVFVRRLGRSRLCARRPSAGSLALDHRGSGRAAVHCLYYVDVAPPKEKNADSEITRVVMRRHAGPRPASVLNEARLGALRLLGRLVGITGVGLLVLVSFPVLARVLVHPSGRRRHAEDAPRNRKDVVRPQSDIGILVRRPQDPAKIDADLLLLFCISPEDIRRTRSGQGGEPAGLGNRRQHGQISRELNGAWPPDLTAHVHDVSQRHDVESPGFSFGFLAQISSLDQAVNVEGILSLPLKRKPFSPSALGTTPPTTEIACSNVRSRVSCITPGLANPPMK